MASVEFYDVKTRSKVKIDEKQITKVKMDTKSGPRYAIKGKTSDGRNLTKFVGAADLGKTQVPSREVIGSAQSNRGSIGPLFDSIDMAFRQLSLDNTLTSKRISQPSAFSDIFPEIEVAW